MPTTDTPASSSEPGSGAGPGPGKTDAGTPPPPPEPSDDLVTRQHVLAVGRRRLKYTSTSGRIVLREEVVEDGKVQGYKPRASVFLTAYTLDRADQRQRPVTFAFNGGPGSSSVWLHLGLLGPRRVVAGDAGAPVAPPYDLVDNPESLLVHSDIVFIDPISTGYSRATDGVKPADYHGFTADIESVGEVIRLWTSRNGRWLSPKYLAGESYGTLRAAGLAAHLQQRHGMYLNGLMLISSVLDLSSIFFTEQNDVPHAMYLPTYAAIAHYHGLHGDLPLAEVLAEAEAYAAGEYPRLLALGTRMTQAEREGAVATLARLTGLSADYVDRVNLRIEHIRFFTELLRDRRKAVGRLDGRFVGWEPDGGREHFTADPSHTAITGAYTAAVNQYVREELGYENDLPYEILSSATHQAWSYKEFEGRSVSVVDRLGETMRGNPHLRVYVACGYYDGATPYFAAEGVFAHLPIPDELRTNVSFSYFEAGHMMYVHEPSRIRQSTDLAGFVTTSKDA
jgi:carboxypeptidase C (cathepsin A)